jgi:hypothetical protein
MSRYMGGPCIVPIHELVVIPHPIAKLNVTVALKKNKKKKAPAAAETFFSIDKIMEEAGRAFVITLLRLPLLMYFVIENSIF